MTLFNTLANIGINSAITPSERRSIYLSNSISFVFFAAAFIMAILYFVWYGTSEIALIIPAIALLSLTTVLLNHLELTNISRIWLCLFIPFATMALSIYSKTLYYAYPEELDYYTFRIIILSCCIFPPILFSVRESATLIGCAIAILILLMLHDPLHEYFNVPNQNTALHANTYAFTNVVFFLMYCFMTGAVLFMKWVSEENELKTEVLIEELSEINKKLSETNHEVESRNREILIQTDKLNVSQQKLRDAYQIIEEQRNLLFVQNKSLSTELIAKNKELTETNHELIKHNNELRQFSYTVSHNLRGPVASLMGLLKLFQPENLSPDNQEIFQHIETSTQRLDNIIKDLSKIIDIRNDIFQIRQKIDLAYEIKEILQVLNREILTQQVNVIIGVDEGRIIYSVRPMVHSILYNLISNAIKYRSSERKAEIEIRSSEDEQYYYIEVRDNGLGIDLDRDKDNLFKLYKRFHHHTEGKGLGLYLVKMQAEALGGSISVSSQLNEYTSFQVKLKKLQNAERQVLYQDEHGEIFFDATLNCIGTIWKNPEYSTYTAMLKKVMDFIKVYNTPNFLADLSAEKLFDTGNGILINVISEASRNGLVRLGGINYDGDPEGTKAIIGRLQSLGVEAALFADYEEAMRWIGNENRKSTKDIE